MKKTTVLLLVLLSSLSVFSMSIKYKQEEAEYDSFPRLEQFYNEPSDSVNDSFYEKCKIEVITISRGKEIYSWFGHCAVMITPPESRPIIYDWGTFAFNDGFFKNFALGKLWYNCTCSYGDSRINKMEKDRRTVSAVELDLTPSQKYAVIQFLEEASNPKNSVYLYKYFTDNCATRVRDLLSYITDGDFEAWAKSQESGSIRNQTSRAVSTNPFIFWGFEFLESGIEDKKVTVWEDMFLPDILENALLSYGKLGSERTFYTDFRDDAAVKTPENKQSVWLVCLTISLIISVLSLYGIRKNRLVLNITDFTVNFVFGLLGCVLFFMMNFTIHDAVYFNENIAFINPLLLAMAVMTLIPNCNKVLVWMYRILTGICAFLIVLKVLFGSVFIQNNIWIMLTVLPYYAINGFATKKDFNF